MSDLFVEGHPAVFWGSGEAEWRTKLLKQPLRDLTDPHLVFSVESLLRRGHHLVKPLPMMATS